MCLPFGSFPFTVFCPGSSNVTDHLSGAWRRIDKREEKLKRLHQTVSAQTLLLVLSYLQSKQCLTWDLLRNSKGIASKQREAVCRDTCSAPWWIMLLNLQRHPSYWYLIELQTQQCSMIREWSLTLNYTLDPKAQKWSTTLNLRWIKMMFTDVMKWLKAEFVNLQRDI